MNRRGLAVSLLVLLLLSPTACAANMKAETLAKRVGQVFAGYDDFWVWVTQRFHNPDGRIAGPTRGRAYFKRDKMFRLNFGQPPVIVHGTDGKEYWIYDRKKNTIEFWDVEDAPIHPLLPVFALGGKMVKALDRWFNVDALEQVPFGPDKLIVYKLVLSLKPERLKELHKKGGEKLAPDAKQTWSFWIDKKTYLPKRIQVDLETKHRYVFELDKFHNNVGLNSRLFRRPEPPGVEPKKISKGG